MRKALFYILSLMLLSGFVLPERLSAQIPRSRISFAFAGLLSDQEDFSPEEITVLENRITSHLLEIGQAENYRIIPIDDTSRFNSSFPFGENAGAFLQNYPDAAPPQSRGVIIGEINRIGERIYLDLHIYSRTSGELLLANSSDFAGFEDAVSGVRRGVRSLFGFEDESVSSTGIARGVQSQSGSDQEWRRPTMNGISGTWEGDTGIGNVIIESDGTAYAELAGNDGMRLRVVIEEEKVRIRQDEPNAPKLYLPLFPYSIASQIVDLARPMSWEFRLSSSGDNLIGEKFTSYFFIEDGQISRVDNTYSRAARWIRIE